MKTDLYEKLLQGPAFLFLGQKWLTLQSVSDPFLSGILKKYSSKLSASDSYDLLFAQDIKFASTPETLSWMDQLSNKLSEPPWFQTVAQFPWSGIQSSAIDSIWIRSLKTNWRNIQPIFQEAYRPEDPRNRRNTHCTCLYGSVSRSDDAERPPLSSFELRKRKQVAITLARRIPELLTPLGTLLIEGYDGDTDWFNFDCILPIIDDCLPGQAYIFSAKKDVANHPDVRSLVETGKLHLLEESLSAFLSRGAEAGILKLGMPPDEDPNSRRVSFQKHVASIPKDLWINVSKHAYILDDSILHPARHQSPEARFNEFKNFLSNTQIRTLISGYKSGFAFRRDFESILKQRVLSKLQTTQLDDDPLILNGQSGIGKTVALGRLAYEIRTEKKFAVLYIERSWHRPSLIELEKFCLWAEENGSGPTLIVWDGMLEPPVYGEFLRYLTSRGRQVVLVGSSYSLAQTDATNRIRIDAPSNLTSTEQLSFKNWINSVDDSLGEYVSKYLNNDAQHFLVALYRLLPSTRVQIRQGIHREVSDTESAIRAEKSSSKLGPPTEMAKALAKIGLLKHVEDLIDDQNVTESDSDSVHILTGLVMIPGRFGLLAPIDLLLRSANHKGFSHEFVRILRQYDIFRWQEDGSGNILVGPRHTLEAKLIVEGRFGGPRGEIDFITKLLAQIRNTDDEIGFATELLQKLGPQGPEGRRFADYYSELSTTLQKLRVERGVSNPRLMLQEGLLIQESVKDSKISSKVAESELRRATNVLEDALNKVSSERRWARLRSHIQVQLAAVKGSILLNRTNNDFQDVERIKAFEDARSFAFDAYRSDPSNFHPADVLCWTTRTILESKIGDDAFRASVKADLLYLLESVEINLSDPLQIERFHARQVEMGPLLNRMDLSEAAFKSLCAEGSCAGYYLRARAIAGHLPDDAILSKDEQSRALETTKYLNEVYATISRDRRCLNFYLNVWFKAVAGRPRFFSERESLPFQTSDWSKLLSITSDLLICPDILDDLSIRYLKGLAMFHLGDTTAAFDEFRDLERESDKIRGRRRIIRSYLASTPKGEPAIFSGTVSRIDESERRGQIYVERLRRNVMFFPIDFGMSNLQVGGSAGDFHLAFNFIGPVADPIRFYKRKVVSHVG